MLGVILMSDMQKLSAEELLEVSGGREKRKPFMAQIKIDKKSKDSSDPKKDAEEVFALGEGLSD